MKNINLKKILLNPYVIAVIMFIIVIIIALFVSNQPESNKDASVREQKVKKTNKKLSNELSKIIGVKVPSREEVLLTLDSAGLDPADYDSMDGGAVLTKRYGENVYHNIIRNNLYLNKDLSKRDKDAVISRAYIVMNQNKEAYLPLLEYTEVDTATGEVTNSSDFENVAYQGYHQTFDPIKSGKLEVTDASYVSMEKSPKGKASVIIGATPDKKMSYKDFKKEASKIVLTIGGKDYKPDFDMDNLYDGSSKEMKEPTSVAPGQKMFVFFFVPDDIKARDINIAINNQKENIKYQSELDVYDEMEVID